MTENSSGGGEFAEQLSLAQNHKECECGWLKNVPN